MGKGKKPPQIEELWHLNEMARRVGLPKQTLSAAIQRGEIPVVRTADQIPLIRQTDVEAWLNNRPKAGRPKADTKRKVS